MNELSLKVAAKVGSGGRFITSSCARRMRHLLGGGNSNVFGIFTPLWEDEPILTHIFSDGLKPPTSLALKMFSA